MEDPMMRIAVGLLLALAVGVGAGACKGKADDKPAAGSASAAGSSAGSASSGAFGSGGGPVAKPAEGSATAPQPGAGSGEMPKECDEWKTMVDKLMACEKMPEPQRKVMKDAYDQAAAGWPKLPAASKAQLATSCKAGADAIMSSAKATCGW